MVNTSQMASTDPEQNFCRDYNSGIIIYRFICSLLFRRDLKLNNIGFWDSVRFVDDTEYRRRIIKTFGEESVIDLVPFHFLFTARVIIPLRETRPLGTQDIEWECVKNIVNCRYITIVRSKAYITSFLKKNDLFQYLNRCGQSMRIRDLQGGEL